MAGQEIENAGEIFGASAGAWATLGTPCGLAAHVQTRKPVKPFVGGAGGGA